MKRLRKITTPKCKLYLSCEFIRIDQENQVMFYKSTGITGFPYNLKQIKSLTLNKLIMRLRVPKIGLEPTRPFGHYTLNVARLPIPPLGPFWIFDF